MEVVKDFESLIEEDVIESISVEGISSSSKQIRTSETVNTARSPLPDKKKGVVEIEVPVSMIEDDIESKEVVESKSNAMIEAQDQRPMEVVKEFDEWFGCTTVPVNFDSSFDNRVAASMSPISKVHHDDHSMDVDNGEEFQSTHPPSIISSEKQRREIRDSFNEDETVFLVNTSFSFVTNPYDLKVSLSNRIREIKAICAHFDLDFESLSSGGDKGFSGLDMSLIESKVHDHSDSVAETIDIDPTMFLEGDVATSFPSHVPAVSADYAFPTSCPIALIEFNAKANELKFLNLVDQFPIEEGSFVRFGGHNPFCSAAITVFEHSIRLYLMTLHSQQSARNLNRKSTGGHYAIQIMEQFNHLLECLGNDDFEDFVRFNLVDVKLSKENMLHDAMFHINTTVAPNITRTYMQLSLPAKLDKSRLSILHKSFNAKLQISDNQDSSIIFIDINQPDMSGNKSVNMDFPLVMKRNLPANEEAIYQTAGAIYWCPSSPCDLYHVSIVTRSRKQLDSILYYCYEYDIKYNINPATSEVHTPVMSKVTKSSIGPLPALKKIDHKFYFLKGVIMFLNVLSVLPYQCTTAANELPKFEVLRTVSETTSGGEICFSNINSLLDYTVYGKPSQSCWLDNSTIYEVLSSFARFLKDERNFVMNTDASHGLIQHILHPKDGVGDTEEAYERFRTINRRTYHNMFGSNDMCVHIAVNEPQREHWVFVLVLVKEKIIIVHDPIFNEERVKEIGDAIFKICCLENKQNGGTKEHMAGWDIKKSIQHPQQPDTVNCGVFSIISSMRAMVLFKKNRTKELRQTWSFPSQRKELVRYRKSFAKILLDDDKDVELNKFVDMFSKT